jgi:uncharacterized damage-inducible protein DinB
VYLTKVSRRGLLQSSAALAGIAGIPFSSAFAAPPDSPAGEGVPAAEYFTHFHALTSLSVAVAHAMPPEKYEFRPHPESMNFGELMSHIAMTNYQFGAGLKDAEPPAMPSPTMKDGIVKFLADSFDYCSAIIASLTEAQLYARHNSPDGHLLGREVLLALYVHVAHHRGQAEIYLRNNGIKPPSYRV